MKVTILTVFLIGEEAVGYTIRLENGKLLNVFRDSLLQAISAFGLTPNNFSINRGKAQVHADVTREAILQPSKLMSFYDFNKIERSLV